MDLHISELFKWLIGGILLMLILVVGVFFYFNSQYGSFQDSAGQIISNNGGIKTAQVDGKTYSSEKQLSNLQKQYGNHFQVIGDTKAGQSFGKTINYQVKYNINGLAFGFKNNKTVNAHATSKVGVD